MMADEKNPDFIYPSPQDEYLEILCEEGKLLSDKELGIRARTLVKRIADYLRYWVAIQKLRFDWGNQVILYINFILLVVAASDNIRPNLPVTINTTALVVIMVVLVALFAWGVGYFMDVHMKLQQYQYKELSDRNPWMVQVSGRLDRMQETLDKLVDGKK